MSRADAIEISNRQRTAKQVVGECVELTKNFHVGGRRDEREGDVSYYQVALAVVQASCSALASFNDIHVAESPGQTGADPIALEINGGVGAEIMGYPGHAASKKVKVESWHDIDCPDTERKSIFVDHAELGLSVFGCITCNGVPGGTHVVINRALRNIVACPALPAPAV